MLCSDSIVKLIEKQQKIREIFFEARGGGRCFTSVTQERRRCRSDNRSHGPAWFSIGLTIYVIFLDYFHLIDPTSDVAR